MKTFDEALHDIREQCNNTKEIDCKGCFYSEQNLYDEWCMMSHSEFGCPCEWTETDIEKMVDEEMERRKNAIL
jgi:hypothetical protein